MNDVRFKFTLPIIAGFVSAAATAGIMWATLSGDASAAKRQGEQNAISIQQQDKEIAVLQVQLSGLREQLRMVSEQLLRMEQKIDDMRRRQ